MTIIDWEKIRTDTKTNTEFNTRLHLFLMESDIYNLNPVDGTDYTTYNKLILKSATETATKLRSEDKRWFYHSKEALLPAITHRDQLLHSLRTATSHRATGIKTALNTAQEIFTDTISLAKATWSAHLAKKVHDMKVTPQTSMESSTSISRWQVKLPCKTCCHADETTRGHLSPDNYSLE